MTDIVRCRACASDRLKALFSLGNPYVSTFVPEAEARAGFPKCARAPLDVTLCEGCGLVQLRHSVSADALYRAGYWFKSSGSKTNRAALMDVVRAASDRVRPLHAGDVVLDIGSNDGTLLRCYSDSVVRVGIEPAENLATKENYAGGVLGIHSSDWTAGPVVIKDMWNADSFHHNFDELDYGEIRKKQAKIVTATGMLYDSETPLTFLRDVADVLHPDGLFVAQLTCLRQTVERFDLGNFCAEHLLYFSLRSLIELYDRAGLELVDVEENDVNGGSYRLWAAPKGQKRHATPAGLANLAMALDRESAMRLDHPGTLNRFYHDLLDNAQKLKLYLLREKAAGKRVYAYGASTKGQTILQFAGLDGSLIEAVGDADPAKWGKFTVGSGIPICSPEAFRQMLPDTVLLLPHAFKKEVAEQEAEQPWRKRGGRFVVVSPALEVF